MVRERVLNAREIQIGRAGKTNTMLQNDEIEKFCKLQECDGEFLENSIQKLALSARVYHRILKIARTIADLEASDDIERKHLTEALSYRRIIQNKYPINNDR